MLRDQILKNKWVILFTLFYSLIFAGYYLATGNREFVLYVGVLLFFFVLLIGTIQATKFSTRLLWMLSGWGLLHLAGGGIPINKEEVLYHWVLVPLFQLETDWILRYDQVVHFYGFMTATFVGGELLIPQLGENYRPKSIAFLCFLVGMGFGALNEVIEFFATVLIAETNVGGYYNTGLDLVFNLLGAVVAALILRAKIAR